jgi:hypothetical protein
MGEYIPNKRDEIDYEGPNWEGKLSLRVEEQMEEPRMFSMNQIRELFYLHLNRSNLKHFSLGN